MMKRLLPGLLFLTAVSIVGEQAKSQEPARKPAATILRGQAALIAEGILDSLDLAVLAERRVSISVAGGAAPQIVENAMLEALQRRGVKGALGRSSAGGEIRGVALYVLEQRDLRVPISNEKTERWVRTTVEARVEGPDGASRWIGAFSQMYCDTLSTREAADDGVETFWDSDSFFGKVIEPLMIVAGAFLIVYLFFTVRS